MIKKKQNINLTHILIILVPLFIAGAGCSRNVRSFEDRQLNDIKTQGTDRDHIGKEQNDREDNILKPEENGDNRTEAAYKMFVGKYRIRVSGFTGSLKIVYEDGAYSGTIRFDGWGNNVPQPLKDLRVKDGKIYFIRSVTTGEEMKKYGSSRYFVQTYRGTFSENGKKIKGRYIDSGTENRWEASR